MIKLISLGSIVFHQTITIQLHQIRSQNIDFSSDPATQQYRFLEIPFYAFKVIIYLHRWKTLKKTILSYEVWFTLIDIIEIMF